MRKKRLYLYFVGAVAAGLVAFAVSYEIGKIFGEQAQKTYESSQKEQ